MWIGNDYCVIKNRFLCCQVTVNIPNKSNPVIASYTNTKIDGTNSLRLRIA
jgi:hypothetical protein